MTNTAPHGPEGPDALSTSGVYPANDSGNADRLLARYGDDFKYARGLGWLQWSASDGRWCASDGPHYEAELCSRLIVADGNRMVLPELVKWGRTSGNAARIAAAVEIASRRPAMRLDAAQLDADPMAFNCANGTVDLRTGELRPHARGDLITKRSPIDYDPGAEAPRFRQFLRECMAGDEALIGYLVRWMGLGLTGDVREQVFGLWHGGGCNGKSTLLELLQYVVGDYAVTLDVATLLEGQQHPTGLMGLRGARLATAVEPDSGRRWNESLIKALTGGDTITARLMKQDFVTFRPTHKLVVSCNSRPLVRGQDRGFWRRVQLLPWSVSFEGRKDLELADKLRAEAPGILAMLVRGCMDWQARGLAPPALVTSAAAEYQAGQDTIGAFLAECCEQGPGLAAVRSALYRAYKYWADEAGEYVHGKQAFNRIMAERGFSVDRDRAVGEVWGGLRLRPGHAALVAVSADTHR